MHLMINGPQIILKNKQGKVTQIGGKTGEKQAIFHVEIDRLSDVAIHEKISEELADTLNRVKLVVTDWQLMREKLHQAIAEIKKNKKINSKEAQEETIDFLIWLDSSNFTFMSYQYFELLSEQGEYILSPVAKKSLGLAQYSSSHSKKLNLSDLPEKARTTALDSSIIIINKSNHLSKVHRPAYLDYIGIKCFDAHGKVIGEHRFHGLYASSAYNQATRGIPIIRTKVRDTLQLSDYELDSHAGKSLANILETYPRDELFQASAQEMCEIGVGIVQMQDRDLLRVFVRRDPFGRFFSCIVYVTRERYNTSLRIKIQAILRDFFKSTQDIEFTTFFSESPLARTHYIVRVDNNENYIDMKKLEENLSAAASTWDDRLTQSIIANYGESVGTAIAKNYASAFPRSYKEAVHPGASVVDIQRLEDLNDDNKLSMLFYRPQEEPSTSAAVRLKLFQKDEVIHLSDVMPMLENLGLRVIGEAPYRIQTANQAHYWILDFSMLHTASAHFDLVEARDRLQETLKRIWQGQLENDGFNRLVLNAGLTYREVTMLRAYARYMRQVTFPFSQSYIEDTLLTNATLTTLLVELFNVRFQPNDKQNNLADRDKQAEQIIGHIEASLENVESLDDDRIIRRYMEMILATLRTNYFQTTTSDGEEKTYLSFKFDTHQIPEIPKPIPKFEIFVYSPDVEGVHLRGGKVARGGLRWSDRPEDFRTEVLGLVKAQQVKNTVIVPVGAKGGFVCKKTQQLQCRDEIFTEGQRCYQIFINGLLDITDNIINDDIAPPKHVVRHDDDDPYLVVAADKGTATFSDLANKMSQDYQFWLGDAFASGGSNGYDHKAMGITAKGAWESVKRHFRECGIDCQQTDFTCIGIGDMGGDVFGNGMLLSKHIKLIAAFNHQHIFIDPTPDAAASWKERNRLFKLPRSSWDDYNAECISNGGGVFNRKAKSIKLTPEIQTLLGVKTASLTPSDLIKQLLMTEVDLLWNGGIGTYVKASNEAHHDVGDRANDSLRINGNEIGARIVGEGGNLGLTQKARIEFALNGGFINTDFIDNVGGVDCSDNEVNIKILLNKLVTADDITVRKRNALLQKMADEVEQIVLHDAYLQSESVSVAGSKQERLLKEQLRFIHYLEKEGRLDRQLEYIFDDDTLLERLLHGKGLTRPENAVLLAYGKMLLKEALIIESIYLEPHFTQRLPHYFPSELQTKFPDAIVNHPLAKEIIATSLANEICNEMGFNFILRMTEETGASIENITIAYAVARDVLEYENLLLSIRSLDNVITTDSQYHLLFQSRRMMRRSTRWLLRNADKTQPISDLISRYKPVHQKITANLSKWLVAEEFEAHNTQISEQIELGIPHEISAKIEYFKSSFSAFDITEIAKQTHTSIELVSQLYFKLGDKLELHWFLEQINEQAVENHWQGLARASFREELDWQQRQLTAKVLTKKGKQKNPDALLNDWLNSHISTLTRWENIMAEFRVGKAHEFSKFSVALRELTLLNIT